MQTGTYFRRKVPKTSKAAGRRQSLIGLVLQPPGPAAARAAALGLYEAIDSAAEFQPETLATEDV